jgi:hypothetical protein
MKPILIYDENTPECTLLNELFNIIGSKKNIKELSRKKIITKEF